MTCTRPVTLRPAALALAGLLLAAGNVAAHGPYRHGAWGWGVGITVPLVVAPAVRAQPAEPAVVVPAAPAVPSSPEPRFRAGAGDAARLEADRRACDREAMGQPAAMADARVFHQTALACMAARGWRAD